MPFDEMTALVEGEVASGFEPVREHFAERLGEVGAGGAAFAAVVRGRRVVDLWAGRAGAEPWRAETRGILMSTTKAVVATAIARLIERGELDPRQRVAHYWPEFAAAGKEAITVEQLLSHSAGLVSVPGYEDLLRPDGTGWEQTEEIVRRLEGAAPEWEPGTAHAYHGLTIGWLAGELVLRVAGVSIGTLVREEVAGPLGLDLDLGTPPERQHLVAPLVLPGGRATLAADFAPTDPEMTARMFLTVDGRSLLDEAPEFFGDPDRLALELAGSNATGTARALATLFGTLANGGSQDGVRLLRPETIAAVSAERRRGPDLMFGSESRWALGFALRVPGAEPPSPWWGPHDESFGADGYGGQIGFADPVDRVGVGFLRSELSEASPLGGELVRVLYSCLEGSAKPRRSAAPQAAVALRQEADVLWASIDRPEARNAIDAAVIEGLERMVAVAEKSEVKVLVIRGAGGTFCAGADLHELERLLADRERLREFMARLGAVLDRLETAPWVNVAAVEGFALARGCELLLACDVVLAAESARIGDRHAEYGLAPAAGGSVRLTEALPRAQARYLLLSGEMITGAAAADLGLVSRAVPEERLESELDRLVARLRTRGRGSLATIKAMVGPLDAEARRERLDRELDLFVEHAGSAEVRAGLEAFRERRPTSFE